MRSEGVDVVYTVATAAYRTAKNRDEVIECIRREAGINVRIKNYHSTIAYVFVFK